MSSYWGIAISRVSLLPKLLEECESLVLCQIFGSCVISSYWGITICKVLRCVKLLGNSIL